MKIQYQITVHLYYLSLRMPSLEFVTYLSGTEAIKIFVIQFTVCCNAQDREYGSKLACK